jgi:hypothetical protein
VTITVFVSIKVGVTSAKGWVELRYFLVLVAFILCFFWLQQHSLVSSISVSACPFWSPIVRAMPEFMFQGAFCCYSACDFDNILMGCKGEEEMLCLLEKGCCAAGEPAFPVGINKQDGTCCSISLPCCVYALKKPEVLIKAGSKCLCMRGASSFPCDDELVPECVCAICAFQIKPTTGFMKPCPGKAPAQEEMA